MGSGEGEEGGAIGKSDKKRRKPKKDGNLEVNNIDAAVGERSEASPKVRSKKLKEATIRGEGGSDNNENGDNSKSDKKHKKPKNVVIDAIALVGERLEASPKVRNIKEKKETGIDGDYSEKGHTGKKSKKRKAEAEKDEGDRKRAKLGKNSCNGDTRAATKIDEVAKEKMFKGGKGSELVKIDLHRDVRQDDGTKPGKKKKRKHREVRRKNAFDNITSFEKTSENDKRGALKKVVGRELNVVEDETKMRKKIGKQKKEKQVDVVGTKSILFDKNTNKFTSFEDDLYDYRGVTCMKPRGAEENATVQKDDGNDARIAESGASKRKKKKQEGMAADVLENVVSTEVSHDYNGMEVSKSIGFANAQNLHEDGTKKKKRKVKKGEGEKNDFVSEEVNKNTRKKSKSVKKGLKEVPDVHVATKADCSRKSNDKGKAKRVRFEDDVEVFEETIDEDDVEVFEETIDEDDVEVLKENTKEDDLVRGKRFSEEEDKLIMNAVLGYIDEHALGEEGLKKVLNCKKHPEVRNCWKEIAAAIPWRPQMSVYNRGHILFERGESRKWTPEELEAIKKHYQEHGAKWKELAEELGKHRFHVKDQWRRIKNQTNKGHWSQDEYQNLFDLVNMDLKMRAFGTEERKSKHGMLRDNICWGAISDKLVTRSNTICCEKWYTQLTSPMVAEGIWDDTDDYRLLAALYGLDACCIEDVQWDDLLDHRPGNVCRKRWHQMAKHIGTDGKKSFADQVELLSNRYCPELLEAREAYDSKPIVP